MCCSSLSHNSSNCNYNCRSIFQISINFFKEENSFILCYSSLLDEIEDKILKLRSFARINSNREGLYDRIIISQLYIIVQYIYQYIKIIRCLGHAA